MNDTALPSSYLEQYLEPYRDLILGEDVVELAINPDGLVWVERQGAEAMERVDHTIDDSAASNLAATLVGDARAKVSEKSPLSLRQNRVPRPSVTYSSGRPTRS